MSGIHEGWAPVPSGELERLGIRLRAKRQVQGWVTAVAAALAVGALGLALYATGASLYSQFWGAPTSPAAPGVGPIKSAFITPQPIRSHPGDQR